MRVHQPDVTKSARQYRTRTHRDRQPANPRVTAPSRIGHACQHAIRRRAVFAIAATWD